MMPSSEMKQEILYFSKPAKFCNSVSLKHDDAVAVALKSRRQLILDNIRDNEEAGTSYRKDIEANEKHRCQVQNMIEEAISNNGNKTYLHILSQYRLLGMSNTELQFEIALRDQVIHNQREAQRNLWNMLLGLGLGQKQILDLAAKQGITIENWTIPVTGALSLKHSSCHGMFSPMALHPQVRAHPNASMACVLRHHQEDISSTSYFSARSDTHTICRQEHHSSYYVLSNEHSTPSYSNMGTRWAGEKSVKGNWKPAKLNPNASGYCPSNRTCFPEDCFSTSSCTEGHGQKAKVGQT